jgi:hypothetical protein
MVTDVQRGPLLVSESIEPSISTDKFHDWYRNVYINEVSHLKGWRRTSRFENTMTGGQGRWFALHEFDEGSLTKSLKGALLGTSQETLAVQKASTKIDMARFKLARTYGNATNTWVDVKEVVLPV